MNITQFDKIISIDIAYLIKHVRTTVKMCRSPVSTKECDNSYKSCVKQVKTRNGEKNELFFEEIKYCCAYLFSFVGIDGVGILVKQD